MTETLDSIRSRLSAERLAVLGGFRTVPEDGLPPPVQCLLLLGPAEPGFWPHLTASAEWGDGQPDPVDRWSRRVIGRIACDLGGKAYFPFGGPPYRPFYQWALRSGRAWASPVRLLVQVDQGLMVSYRGALALPFDLDLPAPVARPCDTCAAPCAQSCPAGALGAQGYDVPACRQYLDDHPTGDCRGAGCRVRLACPLSQGYARLPAQSAYHLAQFHPPAP